MAFPADELTWAHRLIAPRRLEPCRVSRAAELESGQLEVELLAAGICGSDTATLHGIVLRARSARPIAVDPRPVCDDPAGFGFDDIVHDVRILPPDSFDLCVEAVGHQDRTLAHAVTLCHEDGIILAFGVPAKKPYQIPFATLFRKRLTLHTSVRPPWLAYLRQAEDEPMRRKVVILVGAPYA